jgi:hypothetical protein
MSAHFPADSFSRIDKRIDSFTIISLAFHELQNGTRV